MTDKILQLFRGDFKGELTGYFSLFFGRNAQSGKGITTFHSGKEDFRHIGSANTVLVPLRCMFDYARSLGLVDFNPVKELLLQMKDAVQQAADKLSRKIAGLLDIPERCAKPEDVNMFPRGIHLYKLHLVKPEEYPRPIPSRKQRAAG
ncbi:MAG: hypothetical protein IKR09_03765 [Alphaproteobacteria bacterium]|nr:hypothetical protein [Alphaproteobacteria bacterium]